MALGLYFTAAPSFVPWFPILLVIHIIIVALIKGTFSKECRMRGRHSRLVSVLNVLASSLVHVKITPLEKDPEKSNPNKVTKEEERHHSTFLVQFLFFAVVLVENVLFSIFPLVKGDTPENKSLPSCLGSGSYIGVLLVVSLCVMSWICQVLHYKTIHPWKQITGKSLEVQYWKDFSFHYIFAGPSIGQLGVTFNFYWCGTKKIFAWKRRKCVEQKLFGRER